MPTYITQELIRLRVDTLRREARQHRRERPSAPARAGFMLRAWPLPVRARA